VLPPSYSSVSSVSAVQFSGNPRGQKTTGLSEIRILVLSVVDPYIFKDGDN